jgi:hypothetical protein
VRLTSKTARQVIEHLLKGENYRLVIVKLINIEFLEYTIAFFRRIVNAKLRHQDITADWYRAAFLEGTDSSEDVAVHAGLNKKTIENIYRTANRSVVLEVSRENYEYLRRLIEELAQQDQGQGELDVQLTLKLNSVSVELSLSESLVVINALAVKRAQLRGGAWSTVGKQVEKPLMQALCRLFQVPESNFKLRARSVTQREADFCLIDSNSREYLCEVKLMGKGNPESADAAFARGSRVFIADTLSEQNKSQLTAENIEWVTLDEPDGWRRFGEVLERLSIPHTPFEGDLNTTLDRILSELLCD